MNETTIASIAQRFWKAVPHEISYPRPIENAIGWSLPLAIVRIPALDHGVVMKWLRENSIPPVSLGDSFDLHGCIIARSGYGMLFVNGQDTDAEQRFTIAHECAHFLLDYAGPLQRASNVLGPSATQVFDSGQVPDVGARLAGILGDLGIEDFVHVRRRMNSDVVLRSEDRADRLALELLCPLREIIGVLNHKRRQKEGRVSIGEAVQILKQMYGLPESPANSYARIATWRANTPRSFQEWLNT